MPGIALKYWAFRQDGWGQVDETPQPEPQPEVAARSDGPDWRFIGVPQPQPQTKKPTTPAPITRIERQEERIPFRSFGRVKVEAAHSGTTKLALFSWAFQLVYVTNARSIEALALFSPEGGRAIGAFRTNFDSAALSLRSFAKEAVHATIAPVILENVVTVDHYCANEHTYAPIRLRGRSHEVVHGFAKGYNWVTWQEHTRGLATKNNSGSKEEADLIEEAIIAILAHEALDLFNETDPGE